MEGNILCIDLKSNFKNYFDEMIAHGNKFEELVNSINSHVQSKMIYLPIENGKFAPVLTALASDKELQNFTLSLNYRLQSIYFQSNLILDIFKSSIIEFKNVFFKNFDKIKQEMIMRQLHLRLNTILDNIIFHILSLIEYSLTFTSHLCFKNVINDWRKFYAHVSSNKRHIYLVPYLQRYNKTMIALKDYRNNLIHKKINSSLFGYEIKLMPKNDEEMIAVNIGINKEINSMCKKLHFNHKLDYSNLITLHFTLASNFIEICSELGLVIFNNLFDENMKPNYYSSTASI